MHRASAELTPAEIAVARTQLMHEFADVFADTPLLPMNGSPMDIELKAYAVPGCVHGPHISSMP